MTRNKSEVTKHMRELIAKAKAFENTVRDILNNDKAVEHARYSSYRSIAKRYNTLLLEASSTVPNFQGFGTFNVDAMPSQMDTVWPWQKEVLESVYLETKLFRAYLESNVDFANDEIEGLCDFIQSRFRSVIFEIPRTEQDVQNAFEALLVGRGYNKGTDYDREAGKVEFSGKEYIPDFCISKYNLAIEIKLLKDPKARSRIIEEISADITAYRKEYANQIFVVYDLGCIQNVTQFKCDIEQCDGVRTVVIKH